MSFFSNFQTDKCPGPISGNPVSGLNEKVCLQAQRVFDACIKQGQSDGMVIRRPQTLHILSRLSVRAALRQRER